jgi:hypothetical protein
VLRSFGAIFVVMGVVVIVSGLHADRYHNLMHITWGALALGASFLAGRAAKLFCIGSGIFYLTLAVVGLTIGDSAMGRAWQAGPMLLHTGDHVFHLVLGTIFLSFGLVSGRKGYQEQPACLRDYGGHSASVNQQSRPSLGSWVQPQGYLGSGQGESKDL